MKNENPLRVDSHHRNATLDGLRGLAILLVLFFKIAHDALDSQSGLGERLLWFIPLNGWAGVDLFFVLSGFLITGILLDAKTQTRWTFFSDFYLKRVFRILPLYYAICLAYFVIIPYLNTGQVRPFSTAVWYWAHLSNFFQAAGGNAGPLNVSWSLAVEEQFYLLWPLVVWSARPSTLARICVAAILSAFTLRCAMAFGGISAHAIYLFTPCRIDALAVGACIALAARSPAAPTLVKWTPAALVFSLLAIVGVILPGIVWTQDYVTAAATDNPYVYTLGLSLNAFFFGCVLITLLASPSTSWLHRTFKNPILRNFGKYSYCIYLIHMFVVHVFTQTLAPRLGLPHYPTLILGLAFTCAATYFIGALSWRFFEGPMMTWRERFITQPNRPEPGPSQQSQCSAASQPMADVPSPAAELRF